MRMASYEDRDAAVRKLVTNMQKRHRDKKEPSEPGVIIQDSQETDDDEVLPPELPGKCDAQVWEV